MPPAPPRAKRVPTIHRRFGLQWSDDWAWLRDPGYPRVTDPEIRAYIDAENGYADAVLRPLRGRIDRLHAELKARLKEDDRSVPVQDGAHFYHWSFAPGAQYRTWWRRDVADEEAAAILDENELAQNRAYFALREVVPSPDGRLLAYTTDEDGSERFWVVIKDLATGELLEHQVAHTSGHVVWAEDGRTILYVELNDNLRPFRVRAHRLGGEQAADAVILTEDDPAFFVSLGKTRDRRFVTIASGTHVTREVRVLASGDLSAAPRLIAARRPGHRYAIDHAHGRFWIVTNDRHANFRLASAPAEDPAEVRWEEVLPGDDHHYLQGVACFRDFMVIADRIDGLTRLRVRDYGGVEHVVGFPEPVYTAGLGDNRTFATDRIRLVYSSMITPLTVFDYRVAERELVTRKVQEIPSGYRPERYRTLRVMAPAEDGAFVPVTLVHRDDYPLDGSGRLLIYGYGAYGHAVDPSFSPHRLSLLDRGFCYAIAHVRGGDELGWHWYEAGKLESKENSFGDFIAAAEFLVAQRYGRPGEIAIRGGSAGGMLVGAVLNRRPELWRVAIAEVPFVDVLNTMLDPSLPLTPIEWPEWGNPLEDEAAFQRILGYSPYDNVAAQAYPAMFVTAGISDPRVTYWEPAKYVARLRATRTDRRILLLKTNTDAGHFGRSGRYDSLLELAEQYAFLFREFGLTEDGED